MTVVVNSGVRFNAAANTPGLGPRETTFTGLDAADRDLLLDWLNNATGIDTVMDLAVRPWNMKDATAIFGVFETGDEQASWLVVRCHQGWILARRTDGFISDVMVSLSGILRLLDKHQRQSGRRAS